MDKNLSSDGIGQQGFSIVQVMIAFGLMGALSVGLMQMMDNQAKSAKTMEMKGEIIEIANIIRQTLMDKEACNSTFVGLAPGMNVDEIRITSDMSKEPFAKIGSKFKAYNVYIKEMYLLTRQEEEDPNKPYKVRKPGEAIISDLGTGYAYLRVTFVKDAKEKAGGQKTYYGGKETFQLFPIKANFADYLIMADCDETVANGMCEAEANSRGAKFQNSQMMNPPGSSNKLFPMQGCVPANQGYMSECKIFDPNNAIVGCET